MEPLRPVVDRRVLDFVQAHTFHPADVTSRSDGVCRLNPEMAKYVVSRIGIESVTPASGAAFVAKQLNDNSVKG
jgi:hypothetical protein